MKPFTNVYEDRARAEAYDTLDFPGTYWLAFRDLPAIIRGHIKGGRALDFGCGTGRSTRFLKSLGFETVGVDISEAMLARARARDPAGTYLHLPDGELDPLPAEDFDLILSTFAFDNIPPERKAVLLPGLRRLLRPGGVFVNLVSAPEAYQHEWVSFSTKDFAGNRTARSGDRVHVVMLDVEDRRPIEDILCTDEDYRAAYRQAGFEVLGLHRPLGRPSEPIAWVNETTVAPWAIYVLRRSEAAGPP